ncbi:MAG: circularly permuted type 2 ATP-grasp protein, partial [Saprospiraceae bacterium]|nr:circularly permuted type 2 ATP-grasp protein [Saprospiraceae bacterium]
MTEKDRHFTNYPLETAFDEMFDSSLNVRETYERYRLFLNDLSLDNLQELQTATDQAQRLMGMTFQVHGDERGLEKVLQLDIIPRIISDREWKIIEGGLRQRIKALNLFIQDIYHGQKILKDDVVPEHLILTCPDYLRQCKGLEPPRGIWIHITGTDIVRDAEGTFRILEDNLRCPSGVSYMLENRKIIKATFPNAFDQIHVQPVNVYPQILHRMLEYIAPASPATIVVLTPGIYNSAFYEHSYLAQEMGVELVEGRDLVVKNDFVYMRTTAGLQKVDVIYRRIDDKFLDPVHFNSESMLGVPGLFDAYRKGHVALANAPGTGVADDKAIYPFVPDIIKYYLNE